MFNDVGVIARQPPAPRRHASSPASACSSPAASAPTRTPRRRSRSSRRARTCSPTIEAMPARVRPPRQPRQQAARPHEVARRHDGHRRAARAHRQGAQVPHRLGHVPGRASRPSSRSAATRRRAWAPTVAADGRQCPIEFSGLDAVHEVGARERRARPRQRHGQRVRALPPRRHHARPVPRRSRDDPARLRRRGPHHEPPELRAPRPRRRPAPPRCYEPPRRARHGRPPAPSSPATSSPARAPTPATSRSRSRAASPSDIDQALEEAGLAEVGGVRINISGCTNSCGQHHISDIGFFGLERRAHGQSAPGYQMLLGGRVGDMEIEFGEKATKLPAKAASRGRRAGRRPSSPPSARPARRSPAGSTAAAAPPGRHRRSRTSTSSPTPDEHPDFYVDFDETGPYVAESATASAPHERSHVTGTPPTQLTVRSADLRRARRECRATSLETQARDVRRSSGRGIASVTATSVLAASFQDCVLIDLAAQVAPTSRSCSSTRSTTSPRRSGTSSRSASRYDLNLTVMSPRSTARRPAGSTTPTRCCKARKVEPLDRALAGKAAWMSGLRRDEASLAGRTRSSRYDVGRGLVKVNPLATWTDLDVAGYIQRPRPPRAPARATAATRRSAAGPAPVPSRTARRPCGPLGRDRQDGVRPPRQ